MMYAVWNNYTDIVEVLHDHESGLKSKEGWTALLYAIDKKNTDAVQILAKSEGLIPDNGNHTALEYALQSGYSDAIRILLPIERPTDELGRTALMRAADRGDTDMVSSLYLIKGNCRLSGRRRWAVKHYVIELRLWEPSPTDIQLLLKYLQSVSMGFRTLMDGLRSWLLRASIMPRQRRFW